MERLLDVIIGSFVAIVLCLCTALTVVTYLTNMFDFLRLLIP